jgi:hypothetical protein
VDERGMARGPGHHSSGPLLCSLAFLVPRMSLLGNSVNKLAYAPALLLLQDFAYSYRVWITLIKLPYAPLRHHRSGPNIHEAE